MSKNTNYNKNVKLNPVIFIQEKDVLRNLLINGAV